MKHIKKFESFQLNEELFDKVKGWFKGNKEDKDKVNVYKLRYPEEVTRDEFNNKIDNYDKVPFTKEEIKFFKKFRDENKKKFIVNTELKGFSWGFNTINIRFKGEIDNFRKIITKLDDEWYVIHEYRPFFNNNIEFNRYYICDGWEEVLGNSSKFLTYANLKSI
jgi:hypothetical protein